MVRRDDIIGLGGPGLAARMAQGHPIDPAALDDTEYRGISLGLPALVERLSWKTFQKTFHRDPKTGDLRGWNVRLEQRGLDASSVALVKRSAPFTFGHYRVVPMGDRKTPRPVFPGLAIDYALGENGPFYPMRFIVDSFSR